MLVRRRMRGGGDGGLRGIDKIDEGGGGVECSESAIAVWIGC